MTAKNQIDEAEAFQRFLQEVILSENERAGVICGAAMLDLQLETILRRYLVPAKSNSEDERLFGANAPLATFSGKTAMAYRLGLIPRVVADMLDRIRKIRNDFAHDIAVRSLNDDEKYKSHIAELSKVHRGAETALLGKLKLDVTPANRLRAIIVAVAAMLSTTAKLVEPVQPLGEKVSAKDLLDPVKETMTPEPKPAKTSPAVINTPPKGRTIAVVGDVYRFLATGEDTNGKYALLEALVPPGGGPPPHVHSREEEGFYVLEGEITFTVNGERVVATAGMFANMPVGTPHSFKNESSRPARMLISVAPAGLEKMFFEVGVPLAEGATTALPPTKEEIEKLLTVAPKYGIEIKLPH